VGGVAIRHQKAIFFSRSLFPKELLLNPPKSPFYKGGLLAIVFIPQFEK
jgi:hypothetical protein